MFIFPDWVPVYLQSRPFRGNHTLILKLHGELYFVHESPFLAMNIKSIP